jgi:hypothetical protein
MVEQMFGALFLVTVFAPPAAVIAGVAVLFAWPRREVSRRQSTMDHAPAHA